MDTVNAYTLFMESAFCDFPVQYTFMKYECSLELTVLPGNMRWKYVQAPV